MSNWFLSRYRKRCIRTGRTAEFVRFLHVVDGPSDGIEGIIVWVKGQGWAGWKTAAAVLGDPGRYRPLSPLQEEG